MMSNQLLKTIKKTQEVVNQFYEKKPYLFSFSIVCIITMMIIFDATTNQYKIGDQSEISFESLNVTVERTKNKQKRKTFSKEPSSNPPIEEAVDLAFQPGVQPPRLLSRLAKRHPKPAKAENLEATLALELTINSDGNVVKVDIINIILSKILSKKRKKEMEQLFTQSTQKLLRNALYSKPYINGKNVPIKMETSIQFVLN